MLNGQSEPACILVVEDEFLIRHYISESLRDAGYTVIEATSADEAIDMIQSGVPVDLVFSDVRMPGIVDGLGMIGVIRRLQPDLPVFITSGHCDPASALAEGAAGFVRKPYDAADVVDLVVRQRIHRL